MINRIYSNPNIINVNQTGRATAARTTSASAVSGSFADVYTSTKESNSVYANYTSTGSYVSGVRRGSAYAPVAQHTDVLSTKQKMEKIEQYHKEQKEAGAFVGMSDSEKFAHMFEIYAEEFGTGFLDYEWQHYALSHFEGDAESMHIQMDVINQFKGFALNGNGPRSAAEIQHAYNQSFADYFGYGDMSKDEKFNAIVAEYGASADSSYAAAYKMLWMLGSTGAIDIEEAYAARDVLYTKQRLEYASKDLSVVDMAMSRYVNGFYGFDADAEILKIVDYIQEMNRTSITRDDPNSRDAFNRQDVQKLFDQISSSLNKLNIGGI